MTLDGPRQHHRSPLELLQTVFIPGGSGPRRLQAHGGCWIDQLIIALKKVIFPLQALEAKELFRVGQQVAGPLARQTGESVTSYISRRRRWWRQVQELDSSIYGHL